MVKMQIPFPRTQAHLQIGIISSNFMWARRNIYQDPSLIEARAGKVGTRIYDANNIAGREDDAVVEGEEKGTINVPRAVLTRFNIQVCESHLWTPLRLAGFASLEVLVIVVQQQIQRKFAQTHQKLHCLERPAHCCTGNFSCQF